MGRITGITHAPTASPAISYGYTYDAASRIASMTTPEGTSIFTLDATDQLRSASLTGEAYTYDSTGNRTSGGTVTGAGNRLLFDGTYRYAYDAEGNRTARFRDTNAGGTLSVGDTDVTLYGYDQRNRLVAVSHVNAWTSTQAAALGSFVTTGLPGSDLELRYTYDYADRRIRRAIDADGQAGTGAESVSFAAYAGDVRTLEIARTDTLIINGSGQTIGFLGQVVQRNFYGNGTDEILAVDQIAWNTGTPTTSTFWTFTDHQDSVRDIVSGNAGTLGQVVEHRQYDSFGRIIRRTTGPQSTALATAGVGIDFGYAGRPLEARTGLSDNRARWYEPATGRFVNEDPSGFRGGDANLFRYVGNDPLNQVDPSGLAAKWASYAGKANVPAGGWGTLVQQNATLPKAASPGVSAMAYASLVRQPTQAAAGPIFSSMPAMTATVSGTRPIVTPVSQSVSGQAYSGVSASPAAGSLFMTRVGGAFAALGGLVQTGVGVSTVAASGIGTAMSGGAAAPGTIPLAMLGTGVAAHGLDQVWSGLRTVWTGSNQRPYAAQGLDYVTGNPAASDWINGGAGMLATAGAGVATRSLAGVVNSPSTIATRNLLAGSIRHVNPLHGDMNCVNCSIATEATLSRAASAALGGGPRPISVIEQKFGGTFEKVSGLMEIGSTLSRSGYGARGIVYGANPSGNVGHVWNAVNQGGTIRFLDGQAGGLGVNNFDVFTDFRFLITHPGKP
jgi:RHS repeat-associated protein